MKQKFLLILISKKGQGQRAKLSISKCSLSLPINPPVAATMGGILFL